MPLASRCRAGETGTAAIEFAVMAPLLMILVTGVIEIGMAMFEDMQVQSAAEAGALYAADHGVADREKIKQAVVNATGTAGISASPDPLVFCGCPSPSGVVAQDCTITCSGTILPGQYVTVSATLARTKLIPLPYINLMLPDSFTGHSVVRIQ